MITFKTTTTFLITCFFLLSVFEGYGQFEKHLVFGSDVKNPSFVNSGDLDGDGDEDVIFGTQDKIIGWYENDGNGNFGEKQIISDGNHGGIDIKTLIITDIDVDGDLDILSASASSINLFKNEGLGSFGARQFIGTYNSLKSIFVADIDNDGDMDILTAQQVSNQISWLANDGLGNFSEPQVITTIANGARSVFASDIDGDGDQDVLSASLADDKIAWYENDGNGGFGGQQIISTNAFGATSVFAKDIDGDGDIDVVSGSQYDGKIAWYENDGNGTFGQQIVIDTYSSTGPVFVTVADIDNDGDQDVIGGSQISYSNSYINWYENDGNGGFGESQIVSINIFRLTSINTIDLNGDNFVNVLSTSMHDDKIAWYDIGNGNFQQLEITPTSAFEISLLTSADFDNDGDVDLLFGQDYNIAWHANDGSGNFIEQEVIETDNTPRVSIAIDIDNDNDIDVVSSLQYGAKIVWYENDGSGNFGEEQVINSPGLTIWKMTIADLDNDEDLDIIVLIGQQYQWYENDGEGGFSDEQFLIYAPPSSEVIIKDINNDGNMDLVVNGVYSNLVWYAGDGIGNFGEEHFIEIPLSSVFFDDLDSDGDIDLVYTDHILNSLVWLKNDGQGNFINETLITNNLSTFNDLINLADLDNDGDLDVIYDRFYNIIWLENDGLGNFGTPQQISSGDNYPIKIIVSDLDNDGDLDIQAINRELYQISWYENTINEGCMDPTACNYNSIFIIDNGSCCYDNCGCTEQDADNYDSSSTCNDGSCIYSGCTDNSACNFDFYANQDDGSCTYPGCNNDNANNYDSLAGCYDYSCNFTIQGLVFFDENENGIFDSLDYALPYQEIVSSDNDVYLTNDEGVFYADISIDVVSFQLSPNESFPYYTTPSSLTFENGINTETGLYSLNFGVSTEFPEFDIELNFYSPGNGYQCNTVELHNLCYRNMGNNPISGIIEVEYDTLFQGFQELTEIDSTVGNIIYMSFENLLPGEMFCSNIYLHTPTVEFIGEQLTSIGRVHVYSEGIEVAYNESVLSQQMTCAYDPNDKQVFPNGYSDQHYVLPETELEYLIRFQNTGNASAINVLVTDTIDESLDLNSFELVANSHSVNVTIKTEERVIEFLFENIMLPDSTVNEPESHGLISYKLTPYGDLDFETEINNTAYIYFDSNPPIITNTTWTTIYDCNDGLAAFTVLDEVICIGEEVNFESTQNYVEEYIWFVGDEMISSEQLFSMIFEDSTEYFIRLEVSNPICNATDSLSVIANSDPIPVIIITDDLSLCVGESTTLVASGGETYDWNGEGTEPELEVTPTASTTYQVTATNEFDCSTTENVDVTVISLPDIELTNDITLCEGESTTLTASGGEIYDWNGLGEESTLVVTPTATTTYQVEVSNEFECSDTDEVTVTVNSLPMVETSDDITLCEGESTTLTATGGETYDWNGLGEESTLEVTPTETTSYQVEVTNEFDCSDTDEVTVFINPLPTAEITADQITLTALAAETYQWYLNGNPIDGANFQTYEAQQNGNYSVEVTNEFDCSDTDEIIISVVGINELFSSNIQLFPNPMQESSMLYFGESGVNYQVKLFTTEGKLVRDYGIVTDGQLEIQRKRLSTGSYLVEVVNIKAGEKYGLQLIIE